LVFDKNKYKMCKNKEKKISDAGLQKENKESVTSAKKTLVTLY
jgi:hypothetical protein